MRHAKMNKGEFFDLLANAVIRSETFLAETNTADDLVINL